MAFCSITLQGFQLQSSSAPVIAAIFLYCTSVFGALYSRPRWDFSRPTILHISPSVSQRVFVFKILLRSSTSSHFLGRFFFQNKELRSRDTLSPQLLVALVAMELKESRCGQFSVFCESGKIGPRKQAPEPSLPRYVQTHVLNETHTLAPPTRV